MSEDLFVLITSMLLEQKLHVNLEAGKQVRVDDLCGVSDMRQLPIAYTAKKCYQTSFLPLDR